ncbi:MULTISPECIES: hypothetical protein [Bacteria]|uniref:Integral membrane protein n=1 Tax=Streptomyces sindenensis TaxID=67363 RepID=A0ABW6EU30_9ACTN
MIESASDMAGWIFTVLANLALVIMGFAMIRAWARGEMVRVFVFLAVGLGWWAAVIAGPDFFRDLLGDEPDTTAPKPADRPSDDDGFSVPAWLLYAAAGCVAVIGAASLAIRRRRRKAVQRKGEAAHLERRRAIEADHDAVREAYGRYAADVLAVLDRPALDDVTVPTTADFLHAMDAAEDARRGDDLADYREAVSLLKTAWRAADEHATRSGVRHLPRQERAAISKARALLEQALDGAGGEHERHAAYVKARELLDGVLVIPRQAAAELESRHRLTLTKGNGA